jgi:phosphoribosylamine--glycine ligase
VKILIVGGGGREHALLWKLSRDAPDAQFFTAGSNGGTVALATALPFTPADIPSLAGWAGKERVDLTVVGPEVPLAAGIVDHFSGAGLPIFGPTSEAAEIESSKAFAKVLMQRHKIPTAEFETFAELAPAESYIRQRGAPLVVKASGLAAGKGAVVCETTDQALAAVREMLGARSFGEAGNQVVIEEFMEGEELSLFAITDGESVLPMIPAQDHKRVGEGDTGPNTGGMGAYAPVSVGNAELIERVTREILIPTVAAMNSEGRPFRGLLYAGLMLTDAGPRVVEFNCRFGDPETQAILPLLEDSLLDLMLAVANGSPLRERSALRWRSGAAVTTVLAAEGYPGKYAKGMEIKIDPELATLNDVLVFHAGTAIEDGRLVTTGGRVMAVTGLGPDVAAAADRSRWAAERVTFDGRHFRRDIAWREIARQGG